MLDLAKHMVNQKFGRFEPEKFEDQYETALVDLINQKRAGKPITPRERLAAGNVVDLMGRRAQAWRRAPRLRRSRARRHPGQKEKLMPIEGKKPKEAAAKKPAARTQRKSA